jgi:hypothetical protein
MFRRDTAVQIDRTGLAPGNYGARIRIVSDNNTVEVPVSMRVAAPPVLPTSLTVSPGSLDFGTELTSVILTVDKNGADAITVQSIVSDADWIAIQEINPGDGESGNLPTQYRVDAVRTNLAPGEYRATITIASDSNTVTVPVTMQVVSPPLLTVSPSKISSWHYAVQR